MSQLKKYCYDGTKRLQLDKIATDSKPDKVDKEEIIRKTEQNQEEIFALQDKFYADGREGLIIILQARDAAGKDSTIRHVMGGINPQGVSVYSYKQPSKEELEHDYMWRCNKNLPARGMIAIFNRSYYEDVLVVKVHKLYQNYKIADRCKKDKNIIQKRYKHIKNYEEYLYDNSYRIIKIFLNVSEDTQKKRFLERLELPEKNWKFSESDMSERSLWGQYTQAYEEAINETATEEAPWYVIPADHKWYSRYLVSEAILEVLKKMNPKYPDVLPGEKEKFPEYKKELVKETLNKKTEKDKKEKHKKDKADKSKSKKEKANKEKAENVKVKAEKNTKK